MYIIIIYKLIYINEIKANKQSYKFIKLKMCKRIIKSKIRVVLKEITFLLRFKMDFFLN